MTNRAGRFIRQQGGVEGYYAFIPAPPPPDPPLDPARLLYLYVRKEAVLTSQIEGTQSTLADLLRYENANAPGTPFDDVREVSRYADALFYAVDQIKAGSLPLSLRLLKESHRPLLAGGRGAKQDLGEFRRTQNWVDGTRPENATYVPPPLHEILPALDNLEKNIHDEYGPAPALVKAALAHAQLDVPARW